MTDGKTRSSVIDCETWDRSKGLLIMEKKNEM